MVSERQIRTLAAKKKEEISDEKFFTSHVLQKYFQELAAMLTRRYGFKLAVRVKITYLRCNASGHDEYIAFTDNNTVVINANNEFVRKCKTREDKLDCIKGFFAHELAHVLFTDFDIMSMFAESLLCCKWFPKTPSFKDETLNNDVSKIEGYWRKGVKEAKRFYSVSSHIDNIIEDGYIEEAFMEKYKGNLCEGLYLVRDIHFDEIEKIWELNEKTSLSEDDPLYLHPFAAVTQLMLCYAKFGEFKYDDVDELDYEIAQDLIPAIPYIDQALASRNPSTRRACVNQVLVCMWPLIQSYLEWLEKRPETESEEESEGGEGSGAVEKTLCEPTKGTSASGSGRGRSKDVGDTSENSESKEKRAETKKALSGKDDGDSDDETSGEDGKKDEKEGCASGGCEDGEGKHKADSDAEGDARPEDLRSGAGGGVNREAIKTCEGGRIPVSETESVSTAEDFDYDDFDEEDEYEASEYEDAASDIENLLNEIAMSEAEEQLESERLTELNSEASGINYGELHDGMEVSVRRITSVSEKLKEQYDQVAPDLCRISKKLARLIEQQLKDKRAGGKLRNLYMGRKLDAKSLIREDGRNFYKKKLPQDNPTLCVGILIDESGSMSWGSRATYARAAAIVLYDFCVRLGVPFCLYGHTADETSYGSLQMHSYAEFDTIDKNDKYRLMDISARSNNRDGAALLYMYKKLEKRPEEMKLLIVVSDGQPAASGYGGTSAEDDMHSLKNTYSRKGIVTFAAAIGSDKENIERIYGDGFLDITDLEKLPEIMAKLVLDNLKI